MDIDRDELFEDLLALNPGFRESLISRSDSRGGNVWLRIKGEYSAFGQKTRIDGAGCAWGSGG